MKFKGWQKTSLIEYPGKISSIVFTGGCNFRCPFCYNGDLVLNPKKMPDTNGSVVLDFLRENSNLYHAVIVSGGEPTMHKELSGFLGAVKRLGLLAGVETNGTNPEMLKSLLENGLIDFVAMDIKAPLVWEKYRKAAGIKEKDKLLFENVKRSVKLVMEKAPDYEFRTTVVPELHSENDVIEMAENLRGAKKYVLQQFSAENAMVEKMRSVRPFSPEKLMELRKRIKGNFNYCELRNV